jgi:hypothetical protein
MDDVSPDTVGQFQIAATPQEHQRRADKSDQQSDALGHTQPVAGDQEVREQRREYRVGGDQHGPHGAGGEIEAGVHGADLHREQRADKSERPPLAGSRPNGDAAHLRPDAYADDGDDEAEESGPQRRKHQQAELDGDRVGAPQNMNEHRDDDGLRGDSQHCTGR